MTKEKKVKIKVTMKDPDTMYDAVQDAVTAEVKAMGFTPTSPRKARPA